MKACLYAWYCRTVLIHGYFLSLQQISAKFFINSKSALLNFIKHFYIKNLLSILLGTSTLLGTIR